MRSITVSLALLLIHFVQSPEPDLATVIHRATEYVTKYEANLGNLIGTEKYVQLAKPLNALAKTSYLRFFGALATNSVQEQRLESKGASITMTTSADFMLIKVGTQWVPLREVNQADIEGLKVQECGGKMTLVSAVKCPAQQPDLAVAFSDSAENNTKLFNSMKADTGRYNVGHILRENDLPTFALQILRPGEAPRFSFEKDGSDKIDGITVWRVKFHETKSPALVSAKGGEDLFSTGVLWIDPQTGNILKTEFHVDNRFAKPGITSNVVVTYAQDKTHDILLPKTMMEHYETVDEIIDCRADYSGFHAFKADVKFEFDQTPPKPEW